MYRESMFSFVVTCYNYEKYLPRCLDSIIAQGESIPWEAICIDDGSTDGTPDILKGYANLDKRFKVITIPNSGLEEACNTGIRAASSPYIVRVDADDFLMDNFLVTIHGAMKKTPGYSFYYVKEYFEYYGDEDKIRKTLPDFDREEIFERGDFFATATVYTKTHLEEMNFFPTEEPNCGLENYYMILSHLSKGYEGKPVSGTGFFYRRHRESMSTVKREKIVEFGKRLLGKYNREFKTNNYHPYNLVL